MIRNIITSLVESIAMTLALMVGITMDLMFFVIPEMVKKVREKLYEWSDDYDRNDIHRIGKDDE